MSRRCKDCGTRLPGQWKPDQCVVCAVDARPRPGAREWKNMRPRRRTGPMLRVRDRQGRVVR